MHVGKSGEIILLTLCSTIIVSHVQTPLKSRAFWMPLKKTLLVMSLCLFFPLSRDNIYIFLVDTMLKCHSFSLH